MARFTLDTKECFDPAMLIAEVERLEVSGKTGIDLSKVINKCNSWTFPRGFEPGRGYFLMIGKDVDSLYGTDGSQIGGISHTLRIISDNAGTITYSNLIITDIEAITGGAERTEETLYIIHVTDKRALLNMGAINKAYNIKTPDQSAVFDDTKNSGSDWTLTTMIQNIWSTSFSHLGSLNVAAAQLGSGKPYNYAFRGVSAGDALRRCLEDTQHLLILSNDGNFSINPGWVEPANQASNEEDAVEFLLSGSLNRRTFATRVPRQVKVYFPARQVQFTSSTDTKVVTSQDFQKLNPLYEVTVNTSTIDSTLTSKTVAGTVTPVHDSLVAIFSGSGSTTTPTNSAELNTRANEVAGWVIRTMKNADSPLHLRYTGAQTFSPSSVVSCVSYHDFGDGMLTEVKCAPRGEALGPILGPPPSMFFSLPEKTLWAAFESNTPPDFVRMQALGVRFALAKLQAEMAAGTTKTAKVYYYDGSTFTLTTKTIQVKDFFLNSDRSLEDQTKILAADFGLGWVVIVAYCEAAA